MDRTRPARTTELGSLALFDGVDAPVLDWVCGSCRTRILAPRDILLFPARPNHALYVILSGALSVVIGERHPTVLVQLGRGDCAGEMSVLEGSLPSATVVADTACRVLELEEDFLWLLINRCPRVARNLLRLLSARLRSDNHTVLDSLDRQRMFEQTAQTDTLTSLYNRRALQERLGELLEQCGSKGWPLSAVMLDVDDFKGYNDRNGHLAGDHALMGVARTVRRHLRAEDVAARFGGEEFVVLLPDVPLPEALAVCDRLRMAIARRSIVGTDGAALPGVTVSAGVAQWVPGQRAEELLAAADTALYRAKRSGRNRVCA